MSKVQEIGNQGLPKVWVVKSTREGVSEPMERQVVELYHNYTTQQVGFGKVQNLGKYILDGDFPREIYIVEGETSTQEDGYGSGMGDLWSWTYFVSLSKEEALKWRVSEISRIEEKYQPKFEIGEIDLQKILEFVESTSHNRNCGSFERNPPNLAWVYGEYLKCDCGRDFTIEKLKSLNPLDSK